MLPLSFIVLCAGCHSVSRGGYSGGYYSSPVSIASASPVKPPQSKPLVSTPALPDRRLLKKTATQSLIPSSYLKKLDAIEKPQNDSYRESLRVTDSVKTVLNEWFEVNKDKNGKNDKAQLYAVMGASMIHHMGMSAQIATVTSERASDPYTIAISETLSLDPYEQGVVSLGNYNIKTMTVFTPDKFVNKINKLESYQ